MDNYCRQAAGGFVRKRKIGAAGSMESVKKLKLLYEIVCKLLRKCPNSKFIYYNGNRFRLRRKRATGQSHES